MEREESKFVVKYAPHMLHSVVHGITRFDACFYAGEGLIATVSYEGFAVDIYCDGETKIHNRETDDYYNGGTDLIAGGFDTDSKFNRGVEDETLVMDMNSWFDLYCYGEHFDMPSQMLDEAIDMAKEYVYAEYFNTETLLNMPDMLDK